jgi:hypothetical protein
MADKSYSFVSGKLFGKQDYREKKHPKFGTEISFNLETSASNIVIGTESHKNLKVTLFPSFKLPKKPFIPDFLKVGNFVGLPGHFFKRASSKQEDYSVNEKGYREDKLGKLDFKYLSFTTSPRDMVLSSEQTMSSIVCGTFCVEMFGDTQAKYSAPGTLLLMSDNYMNPKGENNAEKFRKQYIRAYSPNSYQFKKRQMITVVGQIINHPFIENDSSPVLYIDRILT